MAARHPPGLCAIGAEVRWVIPSRGVGVVTGVSDQVLDTLPPVASNRARPTAALVVAAAVFVIADLLHFADHVRQGRALPVSVTAPGTLSLLVAVALLVLALRRQSVAPLLATALGWFIAVGVIAVHLLPPWGAYSDSYLPLHLDVLSYINLGVLIATAVGLAVVGMREQRRRRGTTPA
jgi:hypothetical protein